MPDRYDLAHIRDSQKRFDLNAVLCGSEGTLALVAEATLRILPIPAVSVLVNLRYDSFDAVLRDAPVCGTAWKIGSDALSLTFGDDLGGVHGRSIAMVSQFSVRSLAPSGLVVDASPEARR